MRRTNRLPWLLGAALAPLVITGCSSSDSAPGGSTDPGTTDPPPPGEVDLLFFLGSLKAINPNDPRKVITITDEFAIGGSIAGTFNSGSRTVSGLRLSGAFYVENEELRFVNGRTREGEAPAEEVFLQGNADEIAEFDFSPDFSGNGNDQLLIRFADGDFDIMPFDNSTGPVPFPADSVLVEIMDSSNGALAGWLARDGNSLVRVDTNLSKTFVENVDFGANDLESTFDGKIYVEVDGRVGIFDVASSDFDPTGHDLNGDNGIGPFDTTLNGSDLFILQTDGSDVSVTKITKAGEVSTIFSDDDADEFGFGDFDDLDIESAGDRLVFAYDTETGPLLRSIDTNGDNAVTITGEDFDDFEVIGRNVLFNLEDDSAEAHVVSADGTNRKTYDGAAWVGFNFSAFGADGVTVGNLFQVEGVADDGNVRNGTLRQFGGDPFTPGLRLGTLPNDVTDFQVIGGSSNKMLAVAVLPAEDGFFPPTDIFFLDAGAEDSLVRVTDTDDDFEFPFAFD